MKKRGWLVLNPEKTKKERNQINNPLVNFKRTKLILQGEAKI